MKVPSDIKSDNVKLLQSKLNISCSPVYVSVSPSEDSIVNECFPNVRRHVNVYGGEEVLGWQVWESSILIEAELHSVWRQSNGRLLDITPKSISVNRILFIPDKSAEYKGCQVNNVRCNITDNVIVDLMFQVYDAIFSMTNKGDRASLHELMLKGKEAQAYENLTWAKAILQIMAEQNMTKNSKCLCESSNKFKHCCLKPIKNLIRQYRFTS